LKQKSQSIIEHTKHRILEKRWARFVVGVIDQLGKDGAADMAAGLAYYFVLSVFPLILGVFALLGYIFPPQTLQEQLSKIFEILPTQPEFLQQNIENLVQIRGTLGIVVYLVFSIQEARYLPV
jgi:membrane protein